MNAKTLMACAFEAHPATSLKSRTRLASQLSRHLYSPADALFHRQPLSTRMSQYHTIRLFCELLFIPMASKYDCAVATVLTTPELLEMIICYLPMQKILTRVSRVSHV